MSRLSRCAVLLAALVASTTSSARAQAAPPPFGHWATTPASEELYVYQNGTCAFLYLRRVQESGRCFWDATSRGGILTITYPMPLEPGKVRFSVVWVNRSTITVQGDVFHRV